VIPRRLPGGNILVPKRAHDAAAGVIGDGFVELKPGDDDYAAYDKYMQSPSYKALALAAGIDTDPRAAEPEAPAPEQASQRAAPYYEGDWVTLPDGRVGRVDHVMTEGELNLGDVSMPATPDAPVALVSVWEGESFGEPVPVAVSELQTAEEPEAARAYGKPKRKPRKRKEK
jgi:hypothetical protein